MPPITVPRSTEPPNTTSPPTATAQVGPKTTFGNGTYQVGTHNDSQVAPGTYVSTGGSFCYWARLSGLGGATSDIIANDIATGRAIVTIESTDVGFETYGCGTWSPLPATGSQATTMGDGTWAVGIDIAPGTYITSGGDTCYWARLSSFNGEFGSLIANENGNGQAIVTIEPTDKGFTTKDCGTWSPLPASGHQATTMGDGTWAVGIDIAPGTYSTSGGDTCYWARLSSFNGEFSSLIANGLPMGPAVVTIEPTDKGFTSKDCGTWAKTG